MVTTMIEREISVAPGFTIPVMRSVVSASTFLLSSAVLWVRK